jgi:hypothetical protein
MGRSTLNRKKKIPQLDTEHIISQSCQWLSDAVPEVTKDYAVFFVIPEHIPQGIRRKLILLYLTLFCTLHPTLFINPYPNM